MLSDGDELLVIVVSPFNARRIRSFVRRNGMAGTWEALTKAFGLRRTSNEIHSVKRTTKTSLATLAASNGSRCIRVDDINSALCIEELIDFQPELVLYCGGGILRQSFLDASDCCVLNSHSGPLPEVRGVNAFEWALLLGLPPKGTIHQIDRGIDTGPPCLEFAIDVIKGDSVVSLRSKAVEAGTSALIDAARRFRQGSLSFGAPVAATSRQCFSLATGMLELLERKVGAKP